MRRLALGLLLLVATVVFFYVGALRSEMADLRNRASLDLTDTSTTILVGAPEENPLRGRWQMEEGRSPMDDSPTVLLSLAASGTLTNAAGAEVAPTLFVRCLESTTEVFVHTELPALPEPGSDGTTTVRFRVDDEPAVRQRWVDSTDRLAYFAPEGIPLARRLASARTLRWEYTALADGRHIVEFDVRGLDALLPDVAEACGWTV